VTIPSGNVVRRMAHVTLDRAADGIAVLGIDRPPANAMDLGLLEEIVAAAAQASAQPPVALVITGREGFFSAGVDLKAAPGYGPADQRRMVEAINAMVLTVYGLECPVVGAIGGHAIAGGFVLAVCTDLRIASRDGRYGLTEIKVGVPYPQAAIGVVRAELAPHAARALVLGNRLVDAAECHRLGVFDEIVDAAAVLPRALAVAAELGSLPTDVYQRTKAELRAATLASLQRAAAADPLLDRW
jgi:enoyl-CoA hydratase